MRRLSANSKPSLYNAKVRTQNAEQKWEKSAYYFGDLENQPRSKNP